MGLWGAFGVASALVYLTRGNARFVTYKLAVGALLVSAAGGAPGCSQGVECYDTAVSPPPDSGIHSDANGGDSRTVSVEVQGAIAGTLDMVLSQSNLVQGTLIGTGVAGGTFSFVLRDGQAQVAQSASLDAADGAYDSNDEAFTIALRTDLSGGSYTLSFYEGAEADALAGTAGVIREVPVEVSQ